MVLSVNRVVRGEMIGVRKAADSVNLIKFGRPRSEVS